MPFFYAETKFFSPCKRWTNRIIAIFLPLKKTNYSKVSINRVCTLIGVIPFACWAFKFDTKSLLKLVIHSYFNNIKLSLFANQTKFFIMFCTVITYSRVRWDGGKRFKSTTNWRVLWGYSWKADKLVKDFPVMLCCCICICFANLKIYYPRLQLRSLFFLEQLTFLAFYEAGSFGS